jgi:hypothetical protein
MCSPGVFTIASLDTNSIDQILTRPRPIFLQIPCFDLLLRIVVVAVKKNLSIWTVLLTPLYLVVQFVTLYSSQLLLSLLSFKIGKVEAVFNQRSVLNILTVHLFIAIGVVVFFKFAFGQAMKSYKSGH